MPRLNIQTIHNAHVKWELVLKPKKKEIEYLEKNYSFERSDLLECLPPLQRSKIIDRTNYIFVILQFPYFDKKIREIKSAEVNFFIKANSIVVVHNGELNIINEFFKDCKENGEKRAKHFSSSSILLFHGLLEQITKSIFPMLNHIELDIDTVEEQIFQTTGITQTIKDLLILKRNIVYFRKIMKSHKSIYEHIIKSGTRLFPGRKTQMAISEIIQRTIEIWASLENYRDTVNALHETNESLTSHRLNNIMKTLTVFSVIVFPLTLLAAIFGMNTVYMPFVKDPYGFWIITGIMLIGTIFMFIYFKKKKWI